MNRKRFLLLFCLASLPILSFAQDRIGFAYDAAGNRVKREIVMAVPQAMAKQRAVAAGERSFMDAVQGHSVKIVSNAADGILTVSISGLQNADRCSLAVYTYQGVTILTENVTAETATVNIGSQPADVYMLRITLNDHATTWKIVKK